MNYCADNIGKFSPFEFLRLVVFEKCLKILSHRESFVFLHDRCFSIVHLLYRVTRTFDLIGGREARRKIVIALFFSNVKMDLAERVGRRFELNSLR